MINHLEKQLKSQLEYYQWLQREFSLIENELNLTLAEIEKIKSVKVNKTMESKPTTYQYSLNPKTNLNENVTITAA